MPGYWERKYCKQCNREMEFREIKNEITWQRIPHWYCSFCQTIRYALNQKDDLGKLSTLIARRQL